MSRNELSQIQRHRAGLVLVAAVIGVRGPGAGAQTFCNDLQEKMLASSGAAHDVFGGAVSIDGNVAVVGASQDQYLPGLGHGTAYVYRHDGVSWIEEQQLLAPGGVAYRDFFGSAVSVSGDAMVIGAYGDSDQGGFAGIAYTFRYDGASWIAGPVLFASDGDSGNFFGRSVAVDGDVAIVGAVGAGESGVGSGAAYIYRFDGAWWNQEQKLLASDGMAYDHFGDSVSIRGDVAIVGAPMPGPNSPLPDPGNGAAYVYRYDGTSWVEEQKLLASDGAPGDALGESVSLSGQIAFVGAPRDDDNGNRSGSAYVYRYDGTSWVEEQKLLASDGSSFDRFGDSVSLSGEMAIIGASGADNDSGVNSGAAYFYRHDGVSWIEERKLLASDGAISDGFGGAVAISGELAVVGAASDDDLGASAGSAYFFTAAEACPTCPGDTNGDGQIDVTDLLAMLADWGTNGAAHDGDVDGSGLVDVSDMLMILATWGMCP